MQFHKRRQYVVNKAVQYASVGFVFVIVLAILAVHTWLTYWRLADKVRPDADSLSLPTTLLVDVIVTLAVTGIFIAYAVIFGSHKIAGPVYRCERAMKRVQRGDLTDFIKLRKGDLLVPFSEEINLALANLRDIAAEDRLHIQEAVRQVMLARGAIASPEVQKTLDRAVERLEKVGRKLKIDQDAARILAASAGGATATPVPGEESRAHIMPHGHAPTPIYQAAKTMMLTPPDKRTLRGEYRAPGAGLLPPGDPGSATLPAPPHPGAPPQGPAGAPHAAGGAVLAHAHAPPPAAGSAGGPGGPTPPA